MLKNNDSFAEYFVILKMYNQYIWRYKHSVETKLPEGMYTLLPLFDKKPWPGLIVDYKGDACMYDYSIEKGLFVRLRDSGDGFTEKEIYELNQFWDKCTKNG